MAFTAGQKIRAGDLNRLGQIVGRNTRTNLYLGTMGTRNRILSVRAPVDAGRTYRVWTILECQPTDANTTAQVELRYTTNDTEPTTSSTPTGSRRRASSRRPARVCAQSGRSPHSGDRTGSPGCGRRPTVVPVR